MCVCILKSQNFCSKRQTVHLLSPQIGPWYYTFKLRRVQPTTGLRNTWPLSYTKRLKARSDSNVSEADPKGTTGQYIPRWQLEYLVKGYQRYRIERDSETNIAENPERAEVQFKTL